MKTLLTLGFLLTVIILFPGCYMMTTFTDAFIEAIFLLPPPPPPADINLPVIIIDHPTTPPNSDKRRETYTGRGPLHSDPAPARNDGHREIRDSGVQRGGQAHSNPAPARNNDNNTEIRDPRPERARR